MRKATGIIKECAGCGNDIAERLVSFCTKCGSAYCEMCRPIESVCTICAPKTVIPIEGKPVWNILSYDEKAVNF